MQKPELAPHSSRAAADAIPMFVFMLVRTRAVWLRLTAAERSAFADESFRPLLAKYPKVRLRYFDAEAFSAETSDILMWQVHDNAQYLSLVEDLRETLFWGTYFEVRQIIPCVEEHFTRHYELTPING